MGIIILFEPTSYIRSLLRQRFVPQAIPSELLRIPSSGRLETVPDDLEGR